MVSGQQTRRPTKRAKRDAILQAAWRLIRHYGFAKTTMADIAREAGVGKGTAYLYFRSKRDIMLALVDLTNERITQSLEGIAAREEPPEDRLRACLLYRVMRIYDLVHRYPHGEDVISLLKPEIVERVARHVGDQGAVLERILEEGRATGALAVDDPAATGQLLAGLFELLTPPYYRFSTRAALERFASEVVTHLLAGLRQGDGPVSPSATKGETP